MVMNDTKAIPAAPLSIFDPTATPFIPTEREQQEEQIKHDSVKENKTKKEDVNASTRNITYISAAGRNKSNNEWKNANGKSRIAKKEKKETQKKSVSENNRHDVLAEDS